MNALEFAQYMVQEEHKQIQTLLDKMNNEDLSYSLGEDTIGTRLKHMSSAEYRMSSYVDPKGDENTLEVEVTLEGLKNAFEKSKQRHLAALSAMKVEDLSSTWTSQSSGKEYEKKWLLYHFIEHIATHRGQVTMALRISKEN